MQSITNRSFTWQNNDEIINEDHREQVCQYELSVMGEPFNLNWFIECDFLLIPFYLNFVMIGNVSRRRVATLKIYRIW